MWFELDIDRLIKLVMPIKLIQVRHYAWLRSLLFPLKYVHENFKTYRLEVNKRLRFNGQVIILENILNDYFDNVSRGIVIVTNSDTSSSLYVFQNFEGNSEHIHQAIEDKPIYIYQSNEIIDAGYDFIVIVPNGILSAENERRIKAITNQWKIDGKRARFQYETGEIF